MILRQEGTRYEFVGIAYVCNLMDGQAVKAHKQSGNENTVFHIR